MNNLERSFSNQSLISEINQRFIYAKELGRILPNQNPDFIGNFETNIPDKSKSNKAGIFEIYFKENKNNSFNGKIEDCLGTAIIKGSFLDSGKTIKFTKTYISENSSVSIPDVMIYEGYLMQPRDIPENYYAGKWFIENEPENSYPFFFSTKSFF